MTYAEQEFIFNTYFPVFFIGFVLGLITLSLIYRALIVILILQVTGYYK